MSLLFGYGTLRSDLGEYSYPIGGCKSLGLGITKGELWYIQNYFGKWAGVKELPGEWNGVGLHHRKNELASLVRGEVFDVLDEDNWHRLDRREGTHVKPPFYYRKLVKVRLADSKKPVDAFIYFAGPDQTDWLEQVPTGDWKDWLAKQESKSAWRK
jgi:gamma-glutamylcyclotransferase (GGCT)/AIG2-like uncharacterized protein YtfP